MRSEDEIVAEIVKAVPAHGAHGDFQVYSGSMIAKYVLEWVLGSHATPPSKTAGLWK